jgi:hypothetical protein
MAEDFDILWSGQDNEGIECQISRQQWHAHITKRPEIADSLELTQAAMGAAESTEVDKHRPFDEIDRFFRLLRVSGRGQWSRHVLVVSVKYVRQRDNRWIKFYQSCWYERRKEHL